MGMCLWLIEYFINAQVDFESSTVLDLGYGVWLLVYMHY